MSQKTKVLKRLRNLDDAELAKEEQELRLAIWKMQIQKASGHGGENNKLTATRRELARLMTIAHERGAAGPAAGK